MSRTNLLFLSIFLILGVMGLILFDITTSSAPMTVPTITLDLTGPNESRPQCDGTFTATALVKATYPAIPGQQRFRADVSVAFATTNVATYITIPRNTQFTFTQPGREDIEIQGTLDECARANGTVTATATMRLRGLSGPQPPIPTTVTTRQITIQKSDIIVEAYPSSIHSNNDGVFIGDPPERIVTVKCCMDGTFRYRFPRPRPNVESVTANERRFDCLAQQSKTSTIEGKRRDPVWPARFTTTIQKRGGNTCAVGRSIIE